MNISQVLTKLKALIYSKSETDSLLGDKANSSHTHTKSQITDFPTIPSTTSQLTNDSDFITSSGSCNYASYSGYVQGDKGTGLYVNSVKYGNALVTTNQSAFGAIWNAPTKNYRVACATYPSSNDDVYLCYSLTNSNVSSSTNNVSQSCVWNADNGTLTSTNIKATSGLYYNSYRIYVG